MHIPCSVLRFKTSQIAYTIPRQMSNACINVYDFAQLNIVIYPIHMSYYLGKINEL